MGAQFVTIDRETLMMLPPDLREWVPEDSMVHFVIDAVESLDIQGFSINDRGSGSPQYPPSMMLALLVYSYATGRFSSREIEQATYYDVAIRYLCGGDNHPDHDTICDFRRRNRTAFKEAFVKVLMLAQEMGHLKKVGGIAVDGTKIMANASKHAAVSYKRADEMVRQLELEIEQLTHKAEEADSVPLDTGLCIPDEIRRRVDRKAKLLEARKVIEERYAEARGQKQEDYEEKKKARDDQRSKGKKPRGREPEPPPENPPDKAQFNFTDSESRIMKAGNGEHVEQAFNAQAVIDTEGSMLLLGQYVTNHANDKRELVPAVACVATAVRQPNAICADTGYFSEKAVTTIEGTENSPTVYCAIERQAHHRTVKDLERKPQSEAPAETATVKEKMAHRLTTPEGHGQYKKRKETIEPAFGIIKSRLGFRQFLMRGLEKLGIEWNLVTLAYNLKRLYRMESLKRAKVLTCSEA
jgi:transposase